MARLAADLSPDGIRARSVGGVGVGAAALVVVVGGPATTAVVAAGVGVAAAVAAGVLALGARLCTVARSTTTATHGRICRRLEPAARVCSLKEGDPLVEIAHLSEQIVEGDRFCARVEGGDERLVLHVEAGDDVGDQLIVGERLACGGKLIGEGAHMREEARHGLSPFLRVSEGYTDVVDAGQRLRREHARERRLKIVCMGD